MVSKNNQYWKQQQEAQRVPHYGLRKLSIGVASVLLSTTLYMGATAHADTVTTPSEQPAVSQPTSAATDSTTPTMTTETVSSNSASNVGDEKSNQANEANENQAIPANTDSNGKTEAQPVVATPVETETPTVKPVINEVPKTAETTKLATAWQPEPTTNYSADHTAKIDMTNQPTTVQGDNWQMSLDKNYIKAGQGATLTVKYEAQAGDTFVLDIGYPAGVNTQPLNSQIGTTSTEDNGLRTQVTNVFKEAGTYTQTIKLNDWKNSAEGLKLLRHVFGDQTFDLTLKRGTSVENAQDVGRLYLTSNFTPTMTGTGSVGVDRIDAKYVPVLSTNNNYIFSVRTDWSDYGTALDPSYNGDFVYSISVPKTFELDQSATEALYQQIRNNDGYGRWGLRGHDVMISQAGVGSPIVIKATALDWVGWHYGGNEGVSFLGHFVDAPSVATTVTAEGQTTVSDTIGNHTQTVILPGLSAKVINATDYNYANSGDTVFSVSDYGDHNQLYQSHEVPMTGSGNPINLINDLALLNNSPFDVKNATITLTFGDGLHVETDSVRNNVYISNLLADNYTAPNREKSFLVTYQDGTSETVSASSKGDPTKNIKSVTLTRDWNASQMAGLHNGGIYGFVAKTYQDGSPVKVGDTINVSLTVTGINTAGHSVSKTISDTLKVVDQQFAPLTTENAWGGIDKTSLGANPSGTINIHWKRTSGERGKIQLENPTIYFVMPNTVSQVKNPKWGSGKDAQGNTAPTLTSITYEKSKDGNNTVAIMHFSGALIDQNSNNFVPLFFDTVNKDNVVNQQSEGYLYWTADNVNADGLTKIDPTRLDSQSKSAHLPTDLNQEQLSKIYLHGPYWGTINMATGMYSTSATKTATTPWQTQTIVDYHGDGQADVGVNLVNDTSNELHNVAAIINLPKASNNSNLTVNLTGNKVELIDPNTNSKLTDGVTVLYSTKPADLSSNDLSSFVTADQIKDWSKVQAVAVTLQSLGGMTSRQVQIPVVVNDLVANAGKAGTVGTRISADELKPIIVSADAENAAKLVVGGQATIHVQMHYQDAQRKDHYVPLTNPTHAYDILQHHVLNSNDFTPSTTDLAQVPGYELSKASPTIISGKAVIGQPVSAQDDDSVLQFELVPSAQKVLINYVDDDDNQKVIKTDTLTGKTGETQQINVVTPDNYVLVGPATNPSEYTFLASDNKPITIHLKHQRNTTQEEKTVTRKVTIITPDGKSTVTNQTATFTRDSTIDEATGNVTYGPWSENGKHEFATVDVPNVPGYTATGDVLSLTVTPDSKDTDVTINYTANDQSTQVVFVDDDNEGRTVGYKDIHGKTGETVNLNLTVPDKYQLADGQQLPNTYTFVAGSGDVTIHLVHKVVQREATVDVQIGFMTLVDLNDEEEPGIVVTQNQWTQLDDEIKKSYTTHLEKVDPTVGVVGTLTGHVNYDLVDNKVVSFADDWTSLNLGGQTYQMPDGTDVVNGVVLNSTVVWGKKLKELFLKGYPDTDPDYATYSWHGYLSVNKSNIDSDFAGFRLVGNESNALAKATDDRAATAIEMTNKSIDLSSLQNVMGGGLSDFNEQDGQLRAKAIVPVGGMYIPYVEKTATRTINIITPDGKMSAVKQTVTLAKQVTAQEDVHPAWTTGEWASYDVPTIPGYTATQSQVEAVAVNGDTTDQTVNISYTANKQSVNINYIDINDGNKVVHTTTVSGVTDGDTNVPSELPTGYKLVDGQSIPKTVHFNANNDDINVKVQHATVTVTPNSPKTPSDKLPDNPDKSYPSGVSENDLNKTITRTIKVTTPDGQTKTVAQTVKLTRTATVDEVTGEVTYGKWSTGQWGAYDVPTVPGYTANQPSVKITPVNENTKNQTVDVNYTPNKQSTTIKYVDDKGEIVHTTTVNGVTDQTVKVSSEVPAGWTITNGQVPSEITFGADGHEPIEVTVAHQHVTVVPDNPQNNGTKLPDNPAKTFNGVEANDLNKTITRTIKVTTPDGQTKTVTQTAKLTRTADVDEVTGEVTYGKWTTGEWASYDVPTVQGYTTSQNEVPTAKVTGDTKDQTVTVTYTADQQKLIVNFIDDTTGQTLKTVNKDGLTNSNSNYNTKSDIQNYVNNHYRLVSDDTNGQNLVFDNDDSKTQTYNVHFAHNTHNINDSNTVTETIHYKLDNGQKAFDDHNAQLSFTRTGYNDEVTGQNYWNDWQATNGQTFNAVQSPSKEGYTPDKTSIEAVNVKPGDKNIDITVTYNSNAQVAKISYIDDTTGRTLKIDNANGKFNQAISFDNNVDNQIQDYEQQGYVLKSNSFSNQAYQADNAKNAFEVHLIHGTKNVQRTQKITETVNYQMDDGSKAPAANIQSVDFTQDGVQDLVTNNIDWKAIAPHQFKEVITPVMTGYTPDITSIPVITVNFGDKDISKIVTYKANAQTAKISYIDDNTGATLKTDNANGKFNQAISFGDVDGAIKGFEDKGYQLKSNSFKGQKYQADNNSNVFEVHLVHGTKNVQRTQKINETVNYQMDDGSQAPSTNTQSVNFTQNGVQDLVTNNIDWKATESQQFKTVDSPALTGYTPDIASVPAMTVNFGDKDINKTVTYKANPQSAKITYIDDNTGKTLKVDDANGKFNQVIDFANMNSDIKDFENQGYVLKSNSFNGQNYQADNAQNTFEVHFTHGTKNVQRQDTITETVKYQYDNGTLAHENNVQTLNFTQDGVQDLVTKNIDWKPTDAQEFKQVDTPTIYGYTPDITSISATKVNFGDGDINKVVTYQANNQTANIHYVDDMTGDSIGNSTANGKFGTVIDFGNVNDKINTFKNLGYQLVSNGFNGQTYQADNSKNVYYVHFTHGIKNVQRNKQITETIKYQYENGQQAQPDSVQTVSFNENGSQDLVTKKINWFNDAPQQFKAVNTPAITGYTADIDNIPAVVVGYDNDNINKVVTYKANSQTAKINYIDDTTDKVIKTDTANGKFNQAISFSETPTNVVNDLIKRGYKLVSNSFNGQTYQNDNSKNEFTVHLAHNTKNVSKQNTVTRTINYLDNDGKAIQTPTVETVTFTQNGITDLVTGNTTWNTPSSQTFEAVTSPTIKGFGKPDVEVVKAQTVNFNDQNAVVNVHYPKATTPTNVNNNTTTPTVDHDKGKLNPTTFTTVTHQTTPQAHTANNGSQQSITPQSVNKPSEQPTVANNSTKANTLPQTGNSNDNSTAIVGLGLLSGMLGLLGIKGKKKQD